MLITYCFSSNIPPLSLHEKHYVSIIAQKVLRKYWFFSSFFLLFKQTKSLELKISLWATRACKQFTNFSSKFSRKLESFIKLNRLQTRETNSFWTLFGLSLVECWFTTQIHLLIRTWFALQTHFHRNLKQKQTECLLITFSNCDEKQTLSTEAVSL